MTVLLYINTDYLLYKIENQICKIENQIYILKIKYISQSAITCSKLTIETLEQGVKYAQS